MLSWFLLASTRHVRIPGDGVKSRMNHWVANGFLDKRGHWRLSFRLEKNTKEGE